MLLLMLPKIELTRRVMTRYDYASLLELLCEAF